MTEEQKLQRNTEKAYNEVLLAMYNLVNANTDERNFYRGLTQARESR